MNPHDQQRHKTVTDTLAKRLEDVETVVEALDQRLSTAAAATLASVREERTARQQLGEDLRRAIGEERTHRLELADQQRAYVDRGDKPNDVFRARGWRARWRWLLAGK